MGAPSGLNCRIGCLSIGHPGNSTNVAAAPLRRAVAWQLCALHNAAA
jgi:hypothetical protein